MTSTDNRGAKLDSLTAIRGFAALLVVCYHVGITPLSHLCSPVGQVAAKGFSAVGLFYVLSGFVLAYNYAPRKATSYQRFLRARFARIYPVFALALLLALPRFYLHLRHDDIGVSTAITAAVSTPLLLQAWFPKAALEWNGPGWSLSVEAVFYLLFPFVLQSLLYASKKRLYVMLWLMWLASLIPSIVYLLTFHQTFAQLSSPSTDMWAVPQLGILGVLNFNPIVRLPEFVCGVILGLLFLQNSATASQSKARWLAAGTICLTIGIMAVPNLAPYPLLHNGGFLPLWCLLVYTLASSGLVARSRGFSLLVVLGEISYGMYILQQPISNYVKLALLKIAHIPVKGDYGNIGLLLVYISVLVLVSYVSYYWFETPARAWIRATDRRVEPVGETVKLNYNPVKNHNPVTDRP
jgi:peptidoglycan/LPS O-acetylase OafA/YrhL